MQKYINNLINIGIPTPVRQNIFHIKQNRLDSNISPEQ